MTLAKALKSHIGGVKLGLEYFCKNGPAGIDAISNIGMPVFLDLKLHDIPNTVAGAVRSLMPLAPKILTLHSQGGTAMMREAKAAADEACDALGIIPPIIVGVTILTSLDQGDINRMGVSGEVEEQVLRLADVAHSSGLDGIVCSPLEIVKVRQAMGKDFKLVVPGIRPEGSAIGDQKRVMTPREALEKGADVLVIGRPITGAKNPADAAGAIFESLKMV